MGLPKSAQLAPKWVYFREL
ncbi:uncharacterized protein FTOL_13584 [Fusarium torulosum]|uniref:Uncharacterized protein n=1 Tax=Fusarium torulosum TaxID=33205 RepID=A0AAE8MPN0_9HYPO|nr:uncharacterized protein FTOL_13584 [Fusarium torulosum]